MPFSATGRLFLDKAKILGSHKEAAEGGDAGLTASLSQLCNQLITDLCQFFNFLVLLLKGSF